MVSQGGSAYGYNTTDLKEKFIKKKPDPVVLMPFASSLQINKNEIK